MIYFDEISHTYWLDKYQIPSVSEVLSKSGIQPPMEFIPKKYASRGTFIHDVTELVDQGLCDYAVIPSDIAGFVSAYEWFLEDYKPEILKSEEQIFNPELIYAGRYDRLVKIGSETILIDIKTSTYTKWHKAQLTAYNLAVVADKVASLYLGGDGKYIFKPYEEQFPYLEEWQAACCLYWYKRERDRKMIKRLV